VNRGTVINIKTITRDELYQKAGGIFFEILEPQDKQVYQSHDWIRSKYDYLRNHPSCELCLTEGNASRGEVVHHIVPVGRGGDALSDANLISLCRECHKDIHNPPVVSEARMGDGSISSVKMWGAIPHEYKVKISGTQKRNEDGVERQTIISKLNEKEIIHLLRQMPPPLADRLTWVQTEAEETIGFIDPTIARKTMLDFYLDHGDCASVTASVYEVFSHYDHHDCIIDVIVKTNPDREEKYRVKQNQAGDLLRKANAEMKEKPDEALISFREAMQVLAALDEDSKHLIDVIDTPSMKLQRYLKNKIDTLNVSRKLRNTNP
jgi:hypothetical protein